MFDYELNEEISTFLKILRFLIARRSLYMEFIAGGIQLETCFCKFYSYFICFLDSNFSIYIYIRNTCIRWPGVVRLENPYLFCLIFFSKLASFPTLFLINRLVSNRLFAESTSLYLFWPSFSIWGFIWHFLFWHI
jgi:hypothetical protein